MTIELIYKTSSPAALAWWQQLSEERAVAHEKRRVYARRMTELYGPTPHSSWQDPYESRELIVGGPHVYGLASGRDERPPQDSGWRLDAKERYWAPALKTAVGRAHRDELSTLNMPDRYRKQQAIGLPELVWGEGHVYRGGLEFDDEAGELYSVWGSFECAKEVEALMARVPSVEWVKVPRSQWYARVEAKGSGA